MANICIIYGSSTGNTRDAAQKLQSRWGSDEADLVEVTEIDTDIFERYDRFIFAVSTWGAGDLQDDWELFFPRLDEVDFTSKRVAVMALGDQQHYPDAFADCVALLVDKVSERGATVVGATRPEGYSYNSSRAEREGKLLGLLLDEDNQADLTDKRLRAWVASLRKQFR